jgi:dolichol-phosphate mannosyltransferase
MRIVKLSVVIPARDEEGSITGTLRAVCERLRAEGIPFEIVVVNDASSDRTAELVTEFARVEQAVTLVNNPGPNGFGYAIRFGLSKSTGGAMAIMMADLSDSATDLVAYYRKLQEGYDCVFGSRFVKGGRVIDYPAHKLAMNRFANLFIRLLFALPYNDITNAFKLYRREVVEAMQPLIAAHFNLTVEMPLKAIVRGYSFAVIPISWTNRKHGVSKLKIKEMGSRYLFIVLYLWLEKYLSRGDYKRKKGKSYQAHHA